MDRDDQTPIELALELARVTCQRWIPIAVGYSAVEPSGTFVGILLGRCFLDSSGCNLFID
jgi:hypothetical protein